ncbi:MAG: hypothetical protein ACI9CF_002001 [Candidatus Omnitrophota bacterium]|jgi:hypothetical protein
MHRRITLILSLLLLVNVFVVNEALAISIRISEPRVELQIAKGASETIEINITNPTEDALELKVYAEDWVYLDKGDGDKDFLPAGTLSDSASGWLSFNPTNFVIEAFAEEVVFLKVSVPADFEGEGTYKSVLFFETSLGTTENAEGALVRVAGRIGSLVYVGLEGTVRRTAQVESIDIRPGKGAKPTVIEMDFTNTGNSVIVLDGEFIVFNQEGLVKGRGVITKAYTQQGMTVTSVTEWPTRLSSGTYDFVFTLDLGHGESLVEERQITIA